MSMFNPTVEVVSAWWNEEILAPVFLRHYDWTDHIHVILDSATTDNTRSFLEGNPKVTIHPITYPNGIDWITKSEAVNRLAKSRACDWVIGVDADEFIWGMNEESVKEFLLRQTGDVVFAAMWSVYRHESESDIDTRPVREQRRHGCSEPGVTYGFSGWIKPCVMRPSKQIDWTCGVHEYVPRADITPCKEFLIGSHWAMADVGLAVSRRTGQVLRQSENNKIHRHGYQNFDITREAIEAECRLHARDKRLW